MSENVSEQASQKKFDFKKFCIIAGAIVLVLAVVYVGFAMYFKSHFFYRSTLNGVDSSGATVDTVMARIEKRANNYSLTIKGTVGEDEISQADIDMQIADSKAEFEKALKKQNEFAWICYVFSPKNYESTVVVNYDKDKLQNALNELKDVKNENPVITKDAHVKYENGKFVIEKEIYGTEVDMNKLISVVDDAIMTLDKDVDLKNDKCYVQPTLKSDSDTLKTSCEELNKKINISFVYKVGNDEEKVGKDTLETFFMNDDKGNVTYNDEAISNFVSEMAKKYNTYGKPRQLVTYTGATVTVPGGSYGWKIDKEKEIEKIKSDLDAGKSVSRDFEYAAKGDARGDKDYGGDYIEVNRTGQYFVVHKGGQVVLQSKVVTGNPNKGNATHLGSFRIAFKKRNAILKGADYRTPVSYWMPFNGGEGFHDANWQPSFGGTYYKVRGSHGCVNLPVSIARQLFDTVTAGYPVFVYDLPGTEDNGPNESDANALVEAINGIGEVTPASQELLQNIRKRYNKMSPDGRALVTNYQTLVNAENTLKAQLAASGIEWNPVMPE